MASLLIDIAARAAAFLLLSAALIGPLEWLWSRRRRAGGLAILAVVGLFGINATLAAVITAGLASLWPAMFDPRAAADWPRFVASVVLAEIAGYGVHRAMHASAWLWRFHRVHHAPTRLWWLEAWRQHPVDAVLHVITSAAVATLLGVPLVAHAPVMLARKLYTSLLHADLPWPTTRLDRWIATPGWHHRHHDAAAEPANFAGLLAVIDRGFGTWRPRVTGTPPAARR